MGRINIIPKKLVKDWSLTITSTRKTIRVQTIKKDLIEERKEKNPN